MGWVYLLRNYPIPTSLPTKITSETRWGFFVVGLRERERDFFWISRAIFSRIFSLFSNFPHFFSPYFSIFHSLKVPYFSQKMRGMWKMGGLLRCKLPIFATLLAYFVFFWFLDHFRVVVWRPSWASFSSSFICLERSGCLVSKGPGLAWFGTIVVEISCSEGRWRSVEIFCDVFS